MPSRTQGAQIYLNPPPQEDLGNTLLVLAETVCRKPHRKPHAASRDLRKASFCNFPKRSTWGNFHPQTPLSYATPPQYPTGGKSYKQSMKAATFPNCVSLASVCQPQAASDHGGSISVATMANHDYKQSFAGLDPAHYPVSYSGHPATLGKPASRTGK